MSWDLWNLKSRNAHNYRAMTLLRAYISLKNLDSTTSFDDENLEITGYYRWPFSSKRGSICIYYRNSLPVKVLGVYCLREGIKFEITLGDKILNFFSYPGHLINLNIFFESFVEILSYVIVLLSDFKTQTSIWHNKKNNSTRKIGNCLVNIPV